MKILYLTWDDVTKPTSGGAQRSRFLFEALGQFGKVDVLRLHQTMARESLSAKIFRKLTKVARWPFGHPAIDLTRLIGDSGDSVRAYDAVVCRYMMIAAVTQAWRIAPSYVDIDDMPSEAFSSVESKRLPTLLRPVGSILVDLWQRYCVRNFAGAWTVCEKQAEFIRKLGLARVGVLPNLARGPGSGYKFDGPQEQLLMTVGFMGYSPNREGVEWFLRKVWPEVRKRFPVFTYAIAGGGLPEEIVMRWGGVPGVRVLGFVDDLDALYAKSFAVVTPILSGAGTCIKVVEAGLHGRVVLATPKAVRGQDTLTALGGIMLFETADQICEELKRLMDDEYRKQMQRRLVAGAGQVNSLEKFENEVKHVLMSSREEPSQSWG